MNQYFFTLNISYQTFLSHYSGQASTVLVITENGLRLQLPAARLRPYLSQLGIRGRFRLITDQNNKIKQIDIL
ncbi:DUF2835 domain-containing protein [Vibrio porteresiae]|uniref:DUF2835 domain-containing protein n=1 Tax=Vibrio porteresiae DSM 19223 TaxID=1123496 RepID=A0ABZ0QFM2_9VIBR|nr:DUF2835 domain-containing protein [Vibrio porteresiae]WPC75299.1 DUF2835 domain-containing protein [Vibrio porteresiae DSM 19223]